VTQKPKRPADMNKLAKSIVDIATGEDNSSLKKPQPKGRAGGLVGGDARKRVLSPEKRKSIAKKAAETRWTKVKKAESEERG